MNEGHLSKALRSAYGRNGSIFFYTGTLTGGPIFNPLGLANDTRISQPLPWKEIKNGKQSPLSTAGDRVYP